MQIGGNVSMRMEYASSIIDERGISTKSWDVLTTLVGWLDLVQGTTTHGTQLARVEESTHVFVCDYKRIPDTGAPLRAIISGSTYDVVFIDDPMGIHAQLEVYLRRSGGES